MEELILFIKKTKELQHHLEKELPVDEREVYIQELNLLLEERHKLLNQLPDLSSKVENEVKLELMTMEEKLKPLLNHKLNVIKIEIRTLQLKKVKNNQYENPYGNISADGMYLDRKK